MPEQQVIWTALPNGRKGQGTGERLMLSVAAAPRLRLDDGATGMLQSFPDFIDWPARLRQDLVGFDLVIDDNEARPVPTTIATANSPDSELWRALFSGSTPVRSQKFEGIKEPIATFPISTVAGHLATGYGKICGEAPFRPGSKEKFKQNFAALAQVVAPDRTERMRTLRADLRGARILSTTALGNMHHDLAASLLKSDGDFSFEEKLAETIEVAGMLARAAPPGHVVSLVPETTDAFVQFAAFHRRPAKQAGVQTLADAKVHRNPVEEIDFHRILTALGDYPWLMRQLGLVIDLEVNASLVPKSSIGALRHLRVQPRFSSRAAETANYTPLTKYILDDAGDSPLPFPVFVAAPIRAQEAPNPESILEIVGGLLNLRLPLRPPPARDLQFDIITVDVDGAAKKVLNALESIVQDDQRADKPIDVTAEMAPPTLQTSGLQLVRFGHANHLMAGIATAQRNEDDRLAGRRVALFAEDLVRGYRIDIRRFPPGQTGEPPPWLSLHHRIGSFSFKRDGQSDITLTDIADEGFVQPILMQDSKSTSRDTNPIYIHESYAHWQGWGLSAPFPANPLDLTPENPAPLVPPADVLRLEVTMAAAPMTLPRLRFNHHYQLRVRTVDLAGNGLTVDDASTVMRLLAENHRPELFLPLMRDELRFRRFEPLAPPTLVMREELLEGEAADVIVIRSNGPPTTTESYAADLHDQRYQGFNERHVVPPKSSQRMAELHGRLDPAFGVAREPLKVFAACQRGAGTLNDTFVANIRTGEREDLPDIVRTDPETGTPTTIRHGLRFVAVKQSAPERPPPLSPESETGNSGYMVHYEEQLRLPYLPDPLARGAALFNLPGLIKDNESLVLVEASGPGTVSRLESKRNQDQLLPQQANDELGQLTKIGFPAAAEWPEFLCFRLRLDGHTPGSTTPAGTAPKPAWSEVNGVRVLTVRLAPAEVTTIWISTYPDRADVDEFGLNFWWDKLGAEAANREFMNLAQHGALAALSPARKITLVHAVQQPLIAPTSDGAPLEPRKFSGETAAYIAGGFKIHGGSTEKIDLLASWTEPLPESEDTKSIETHVLELPIHPGREPPNIHGNPVPIGSYFTATDRFEFHAPDRPEDARSRSWLSRHEFGDTKHRRVTYRLVATTRFKEYFPERIIHDTEKIVRATTFENVIVRNSARPPALEITSIIPAFKWVRNFQLTSSARSGGWLRVYLGRRWFETGQDEALAVVGEPVAGIDPLHARPFSGGASTIKPKGPQPVHIVGRPGEASVAAFPFPVHHDAELGLWYADIAFEAADTYFPFIALRLARFQEHSVDGLQLSPIVEAGFHQLLPDRAVSITRSDSGDKRKIDIAVSGAGAPAAGLLGGGRLAYQVEVDIEERVLGGSVQRERDLGWKRSATVVPVVATDPKPALWKGHVLVPLIADMERRIVIKEFELFPRNDLPPGQAWSGDPAGGPSRRLVYADVILIR